MDYRKNSYRNIISIARISEDGFVDYQVTTANGEEFVISRNTGSMTYYTVRQVTERGTFKWVVKFADTLQEALTIVDKRGF